MPNGQVWSGTAGVGRQGFAITETTLFHGASTTKFNIAILMLLLAEEDLVDLDETWSSYVSLDVEFDPLITVRQLLNHTSGIADYLETAGSGAYITSDFNYFYTPQYILENIVSDTPVFPAGTSFQYSNSNYVLAGLIADAVTGNSVHIELSNRIWNPLGMEHTYFGAYDTYTEQTAGVWWDFGQGLQNYSEMPTTSMLSYAYGAGNIVTCPADLATLLNAIINGQLLSTESFDEMKTFVPASYSSWTAGYGLGIHHMNGEAEDNVLGHDGYYTNLTDMFHSEYYGFTLVTMTNTQTGWFGIFNPMYDILTNYFINTEAIELKNKNDLSLYPNPANNQFSIKSSKIIEEIEIRDVFGKVLYQAYPNNKNITLTIDKDGLYFVTIKSGQQTITRKLIVKN